MAGRCAIRPLVNTTDFDSSFNYVDIVRHKLESPVNIPGMRAARMAVHWFALAFYNVYDSRASFMIRSASSARG